MKTIYLIRHAETYDNLNGIYVGQKGGGITSKGKNQAELLGKQLRKFSPEIILSSDIIRCKETINIMNKQLQLPVTYLRLLRERSLGDWAGIHKDEFYKTIKESGIKESYFRPPGGESHTDVLERVKILLDFIPRVEQNKIIVVSHGRFNKILINYLLGQPIDIKIKQDNCCLNIIQLKDKKYYILSNSPQPFV